MRFSIAEKPSAAKDIEDGDGGTQALPAMAQGDAVRCTDAGAVLFAGGRAALPISTLCKCMACGHGLIRRPTKKSSVFWWACSNFPQCKQSYAESKNPKLKGRPDYSSGRNINHEQEV